MWSDPAFNEKSDCGTSAGPRPLPLNLCVRSQHQKNRIFMYKSDLREIRGSVLLCFLAAIDSSGDGKAKSGLKFFVTQKLTAWQLF